MRNVTTLISFQVVKQYTISVSIEGRANNIAYVIISLVVTTTWGHLPHGWSVSTLKANTVAQYQSYILLHVDTPRSARCSPLPYTSTSRACILSCEIPRVD